MGFFRNLARKAVDRFGEIIEGAGKITGISFIEDIGFNIQMNNPFDDLGQIDVENSSLQDSINISAECEKVTKKAAREADDIEVQCIKNIKDKIEKYVCQLEEIFPSEVIDSFGDYSVEKAFRDEIKNTISGYISQKISIDNEEFVSILKKPVQKRKEESDEFIEKTLAEAKKELKNKCQNKLNSTLKRMYEDIEDYLVTQHDYSKEYEENCKEMQEHKDDMRYKKKMVQEIMTDIAFSECIKSLTYFE